nr:MAG TPA: DNA polymerase III subunit alpha [Caudoviricetes sp.]
MKISEATSASSESECNADGTTDRSEKGKSLLLCTKDFTVIDIETTGLSTTADSIIEVGAIRFREGKPIALFQKLVNPGKIVSPFIVQLTGITNEMLADEPCIDEVLPEYLDFIGSDIIVGHNVHFDINFLYDNCVALDLPPIRNDLVDTMRIARLLHKDWSNHSLYEMATCLGVKNSSWHRSLGDCEVTAKCYLKMTADDPQAEAKLSASKKKSIKISGIKPTVTAIDESNPLHGKVCVFTGALSISRETAMQVAVNCGAIVKPSVSSKVDYLIMGDQDIRRGDNDGMSSKEEKARALNEEGKAKIVFLGETEFLNMVGEEQLSLVLNALSEDDFNEQISDSPLRGKICVFAGELSITRDEAVQLAESCGAKVSCSVSKNVDYLIRRDKDESDYDFVSWKERKAISLNESGDANIVFLGEHKFLKMLGKESPDYEPV